LVVTGDRIPQIISLHGRMIPEPLL
jgi:hypothetical protein